jgi:hypothetical protein
MNQMPTCRVFFFFLSTFYAAINIFNSLPPSLTVLHSDKEKFKAAVKMYFNTQSFDSVDEFSVCVCKGDP